MPSDGIALLPAPGRLVAAWTDAALAASSGAPAMAALARRIVDEARRAGAPRHVVWLDPGGPAAAGAEGVLTAFPVAVRHHPPAPGGLATALDQLAADARPAGASFPGMGFAGGWLGFLAYEAVEDLEPVRLQAPRDLDVPRSSWALHPVWFRHDGQRARLELWSRLDQAASWPALVPELASWEGFAEASLRQPAPAVLPSDAADVDRLLPHAARSFDQTAFEAAVRTVQDAIREGEVFQANVAHRLTLANLRDPFDVHLALRARNPSPHAAYLEASWGAIVSNSPELLAAVSRDATGSRRIVARPIAGTRPRADAPGDDRRLVTELKRSEKERAEHTMLVDLARNDIGRVAVPGSVKVDAFQTVEAYSHVHHLVSTVTGTLAPAAGVGAVVRALFPGGTVTGAPKLRSIEVIDKVEPVQRGPYTGSLGWVNGDGTLGLNILIRTLLFTRGRVHAYAGAGIVADSHPAAEYQETLDKAAAMLLALAATGPGHDAPGARAAPMLAGTAP